MLLILPHNYIAVFIRRPIKLWAAKAITVRCHYVPTSVPMSHANIRTSTQRISVKFREISHHQLIIYWAKLYQGQGSRLDHDRKFESTSNRYCHDDFTDFTVYTTRCVHRAGQSTHAAAEAS